MFKGLMFIVIGLFGLSVGIGLEHFINAQKNTALKEVPKISISKADKKVQQIKDEVIEECITLSVNNAGNVNICEIFIREARFCTYGTRRIGFVIIDCRIYDSITSDD